MRTPRHGIMILLAICSLGIPAAWSAEPNSSGAQDRVDDLMMRYNLHPAFEKLGRGVSNALFGWLEVPLNIHKRYTPGDTGASFFTGVAHGVFKGLVRTGVGVYEAVTWFLPYPEDYVPILPTLDYFKAGTTRKRLPIE